VNFLVNLQISLVFNPFSFTKKGIMWPSLIESKHVIVPRKSNKHIYDIHMVDFRLFKVDRMGVK
jgi:hypothetical protein